MSFIKLVISLLISFLAAAIGSLATIPNIPTWYAQLDKPFFNPPNWLFGPVWTVLYILIGISFYLIWTTKTSRSKHHLYSIFATQIILNALWSIVFFGLHQTWLGLVVILMLLTGIVMMIFFFRKVSRLSAYLLIPYALWVTFASCLNLAIAVMN